MSQDAGYCNSNGNCFHHGGTEFHGGPRRLLGGTKARLQAVVPPSIPPWPSESLCVSVVRFSDRLPFLRPVPPHARGVVVRPLTRDGRVQIDLVHRLLGARIRQPTRDVRIVRFRARLDARRIPRAPPVAPRLLP